MIWVSLHKCNTFQIQWNVQLTKINMTAIQRIYFYCGHKSITAPWIENFCTAAYYYKDRQCMNPSIRFGMPDWMATWNI